MKQIEDREAADDIVFCVLERYRHEWLECLKDSLGDPEFSDASVYDHMIDGVLGFQAAMEHL